MNELAYYLDKYFAELELQEILAAKETGFSKHHIDRAWEEEEWRCAPRDRLMALWNWVKNGGRGAWQTHYKKPIKAGL